MGTWIYVRVIDRWPAQISINLLPGKQGGRTWQPFVGGINGHENFRQARIYNFRGKKVKYAIYTM